MSDSNHIQEMINSLEELHRYQDIYCNDILKFLSDLKSEFSKLQQNPATPGEMLKVLEQEHFRPQYKKLKELEGYIRNSSMPYVSSVHTEIKKSLGAINKG